MKGLESSSSASREVTPREAYLQRRQEVARHFFGNPLIREIVQFQDGARVKAVFGIWQVPEHLKTHSEKSEEYERVTVFLPGIFHDDRNDLASPNLEVNDPLEIKLAAALLRRCR